MGLSAIEWAAHYQNPEMASLKESALVSKTKISSAQEKQAYSLENCEMIAGKLAETKKQIEEDKDTIEETKADIQDTKDKAEKDIEEETLNCLSKEITVNKFCPDQGMNCGMGMGMGDTYTSKGAITLTVEELNALDGVLADFSEDRNQTDNSEKIATHLNNTLKSGATATAGTNDDGTKFVEIRRANGSSVKICDANGNGALDVKDYAFCDAIKEAKKEIEKMNSKVEQIESTAQSKVDSLVDKKTVTQENLERLETEEEEIEGKQLPDAQKESENADEEFSLETKKYDQINTKMETTKTKLEQQKKEKTEQQVSDKNKKKQNNNIFTQNATNPIGKNETYEQQNDRKLLI